MEDFHPSNHTSKLKKYTVLLYFSLWLMIGLNIYLTVKAFLAFSTKNRPCTNSYYSQYRVIRWLPVMQILIHTASTISRFIQIFANKFIMTLAVFQTILESSQGIIILVIFIVSPPYIFIVKELWFRLFHKEQEEITNPSMVNTTINTTLIMHPSPTKLNEEIKHRKSVN